MKDQINEIKITTANMLAEQDSMKSENGELKKSNKNAEYKMPQFETIVTKLMSTSESLKDKQSINVFCHEKIINELQEQKYIMIGLLESTLLESAARHAADLNGVKNILQNTK